MPEFGGARPNLSREEMMDCAALGFRVAERSRARREAKYTKIHENRFDLLDALELIGSAVQSAIVTAKTLADLGIDSTDLVDALARGRDQVCRVMGELEEAVDYVDEEELIDG